MNLIKIKKNLCKYDERNPNYDPEYIWHNKPCHCDNCFHGRTELAEEILRLWNNCNPPSHKVTAYND